MTVLNTIGLNIYNLKLEVYMSFEVAMSKLGPFTTLMAEVQQKPEEQKMAHLTAGIKDIKLWKEAVKSLTAYLDTAEAKKAVSGMKGEMLEPKEQEKITQSFKEVIETKKGEESQEVKDMLLMASTGIAEDIAKTLNRRDVRAQIKKIAHHPSVKELVKCTEQPNREAAALKLYGKVENKEVKKAAHFVLSELGILRSPAKKVWDAVVKFFQTIFCCCQKKAKAPEVKVQQEVEVEVEQEVTTKKTKISTI